MYILAKNLFFQNIMRQFFFNLDKVVFGLISKLYDLLLTIARTSPLSQGDISNMADRIYKLLAIFMIFKVTFSLIMYVVNPDDFTEKNKGATSLLKNVVLSLAILILTPFAFRYAYQFQEIILESNALASLVFGEEKAKQGFFNTAGESMAYTALSPFFVPDTSIDKLSNCTTLIIDGKFNQECSGLDNETYMPISDTENTLYALTDAQTRDNSFSTTDLRNYVVGVEKSNMGLAFRSNIATATFKDGNQDERYIMDYSYFVSTAVGVVVALLLISFCMDIGVRSIKLAFLQLIAPIPIISYIDPKSGKDGLFKKWYKMCFSTFLSLFIRLIAIYFAVYIISKVADHKLVDVIDGSYVASSWVALFILIGALMFAKQFPKILESLGVKIDGGGKFTLNPIKKISDEAMFGKQALGLGATAAAAGLAGAVNFGSRAGQVFNRKNWRDENGKLTLGKGLGSIARVPASAIGGAVGTAYRGIGKSIKGEKPGKVFSNSYGEAMFAKLKREDNARKVGADTFGKKIELGVASLKSDVMRHAGVLNEGQREYLEAARQDADITRMQNEISSAKVQQAQLRKSKFEAYEKAQAIGKNIDTLLESNSSVKAAKTAYENAKMRGASDFEIEKLRLEYKGVKGRILEAEMNQENSYIKNQVEVYNSIQSGMTKEQQDKFKAIDTKVTYKKSDSGKYIEVNGAYYQVDQDESGHIFYQDSEGNKHYESEWDSSALRYDVDKSGVSIIGDNDDVVTGEKMTFENSEENVKFENEIKTNEQKIEALKASDEYKRYHDENSLAKIANASRRNKEIQQPGFKPSSGPIDSKVTDTSTMTNFNNNGRGPSVRPPINPGGGPNPGGMPR